MWGNLQVRFLGGWHSNVLFLPDSPLTVPKSLKGEIKRPDFLVGIPTIGTLAFDVKAKTVYENSIIIDEYEHRTSRTSRRFFNMRVWYVCFPPDELRRAICS